MSRFMPSISPFATPPPNRGPLPFGEASPGDATSSAWSSAGSTVKLSCLSPDGRAVHSLAFRQCTVYIDTHSLPLVGTVEEQHEPSNNGLPAVIQTKLPERVQMALQRYPALELLCVDVDNSAPRTSSSPQKQQRIESLPRLCLYTKRDVFLLELGYDSRYPEGATEVQGQVLGVREPYDEVLLGTSTSLSILRIRPAPQRDQGYVTMCPPGCMAMLTHDSTTNEYSLILYHGKEGSVGTPVVFGMEQLEESVERITDFCFCHSNALSLLSALTVAFLKGTGDVMVATPILFRGTVLPRATVTKSLEFLEEKLNDVATNTPMSRLYRAAQNYLTDAFPDDGRSHFLTAQERSPAFDWPVQMQGPILVAPETDDFESLASAIEPISAGELVGMVVGHLGRIVEFGVVAPSTLVPRFKYESEFDTQELDSRLSWGAVVNRVDLREDENDRQPYCKSLGLLRDPIMDNVVHFVSPTGIQSIYTNSAKLTANKIREQGGGPSTGMFSPPSRRPDLRPRTTAWSCIDVSGMQDQTSNAIAGAVVSGDVQLGHVLVTRLFNGSMVAVNLTEARQLHELEALGEYDQLARQSRTAADRELVALLDSSPLVDIVEPLLQKLISGIGAMSKVVGTSTPSSKITPDMLAAAVSIKERCDNEILMPLLEMNEHVKARRIELATMYENQMEQLKTLQDRVSELKDRDKAIAAKVETVRVNAISLAQRSSSVLQSSNDLMPTITQAEYDYFQELKRLDDKTQEWQQNIETMKAKVSILLDSVEEGITAGALNLPEESIQQSNTLLKGCGGILDLQRSKLEDVEFRMDELAAIAGIDRNPNGPVGRLQ